jgi:hypothetical protein
MRQNDGLANGQPQPVAGHLRLLRRLVAEERLENTLAILSPDARSFILDGELHFAVVVDPSRDTDWRGWWRIFDRVLDQVGEHPLHLTRNHPN